MVLQQFYGGFSTAESLLPGHTRLMRLAVSEISVRPSLLKSHAASVVRCATSRSCVEMCMALPSAPSLPFSEENFFCCSKKHLTSLA